VKPRQVDFELFHQSPEAENCYGPFSKEDLTDAEIAFDWADPKTRLIWEGCLDASKLAPDPDRGDIVDMVLRIDVYVGERDKYGVGFSDNVIFRKQYYLRAVLSKTLTLFRHAGEQFMQKQNPGQPIPNNIASADDYMDDETGAGWTFEVGGTGFTATLGLELDYVPEAGPCIPLRERIESLGPKGVIGKSGMPSSQNEMPPGA
jgi:hypothetical protein